MAGVNSELSFVLLVTLLLGVIIGGLIVGLMSRYKRRRLILKHEHEIDRLNQSRQQIEEERSLVVRSLETQRQSISSSESQVESLQAHVRRQMQRIASLDAELEASEARNLALERDFQAYRMSRDRGFGSHPPSVASQGRDHGTAGVAMAVGATAAVPQLGTSFLTSRDEAFADVEADRVSAQNGEPYTNERAGADFPADSSSTPDSAGYESEDRVWDEAQPAIAADGDYQLVDFQGLEEREIPEEIIGRAPEPEALPSELIGADPYPRTALPEPESAPVFTTSSEQADTAGLYAQTALEESAPTALPLGGAPVPVLRKRAPDEPWPDLLDPLDSNGNHGPAQGSVFDADDIPELDEAELAELTGEWEPLELLEGEEL